MRKIMHKAISMLIIFIFLFNTSSTLIFAATEEIEKLQEENNKSIDETSDQHSQTVQPEAPIQPEAPQQPVIEEFSEEKTEGNIKYKISSNNYVIITGYLGNETNIQIPDTLEELPIEKISNNVFEGNTNVERINLPDSIRSIGKSAFSGCINLEEINYPKSLEEVITSWVYASIFAGCEKLKRIEIPEGVTKIPAYTFANSKLEEIKIPSTLEEIGDSAFYNCTELININLPDSIRSIDLSAFSGCINLEKINYPKGLESVGYPGIICGIFNRCYKLKRIEVPEGVKRIPYDIFAHSKLEEIKLPSTLEEIGDSAFYNCTELKTIKLPDSIRRIGDNAFAKCINLEEINYPKGLETFFIYLELSSSGIFTECDKLKRIEVPEGVTKIPGNIFANSKLEEIKLPSTLEKIGDNAFYNCTELTNINLSDSIRIIGNLTFYGCNNLVITMDNFKKSCIEFINGGIRNFRFKNNKILEEANAIDEENSSYRTNFSSNVSGENIAITCEYAIKEGRKQNAKSISIKIPYNAELINKSLYINNELCQNYTEDESHNIITIPISEEKGKITFNIKMTECGGILSYALLNYEIDGNTDYDIIGFINNQVDTVSIQTASVTNIDRINVSGVSGQEQDVEIYIGETLIKTVKTNKVGSYNTTIELPNVNEGKVYNLRAKIVNNNEEVWANTEIKYSIDTPVMTSFKMNYMGKEYDLLGKISPMVIFSPQSHGQSGNNMTFEIKFTNPENVSNVYVTSDRNNTSKRINAEWSEEKQAFVTSEYFDDDLDYVPGKLNVFFKEKPKKELQNIEIGKKEYKQLFEDISTEIVSQNNNGYEMRLGVDGTNDVLVECKNLTKEEAFVEMLGREEYEKLFNTLPIPKARSASSDFVTEFGLKFLKDYEISVTQDIYGIIYFNGESYDEDTGKTTIFGYAWDTSTDTFKKEGIKYLGKELSQSTAKAIYENLAKEKGHELTKYASNVAGEIGNFVWDARI